MDLSSEVLASIVATAGKWSLNMATAAHPAEKPRAKKDPTTERNYARFGNSF